MHACTHARAHSRACRVHGPGRVYFTTQYSLLPNGDGEHAHEVKDLSVLGAVVAYRPGVIHAGISERLHVCTHAQTELHAHLKGA